jgi:putative ABC transport system permease protein
VYAPYYQATYSRALSLAVRGTVDAAALLSAVRQRIRSVEPGAPVYNTRTMGQVLAESVAQPRFSTILLGTFAGLALILAAVGIYGVISVWVSQGTHEIGVRMALGARPGDVFRLIVGQGLTLVSIGIGIGLVGALGLTRSLEGLLFGVGATDAVTFVGISAILIAVALLACYLPARRATQVDPVESLRYE